MVTLSGMQVLKDPPENLVVSILKASGRPLVEQFAKLPPDAHMAALRTAFPTISSHRS